MQVFVVGRDQLPPELAAVMEAMGLSQAEHPASTDETADRQPRTFSEMIAEALAEQEQADTPESDSEADSDEFTDEEATFASGYAAAYGVCLACAPDEAATLITDLVVKLRRSGQL